MGRGDEEDGGDCSYRGRRGGGGGILEELVVGGTRIGVVHVGAEGEEDDTADGDVVGIVHEVGQRGVRRPDGERGGAADMVSTTKDRGKENAASSWTGPPKAESFFFVQSTGWLVQKFFFSIRLFFPLSLTLSF